MRNKGTETEVYRVLQSINLHSEYAGIMDGEGYKTSEDLITATEGDLMELGMKKPHMRRLMNEVKKRYPTAKMEQGIIDTATILGAERLDKLLLMKGYQVPFGPPYLSRPQAEAQVVDDRRKVSEIAAKMLNIEKKGSRICRHFNTKHGCWLADSCGFLHEAPGQHKNREAPTEQRQPNGSNGHGNGHSNGRRQKNGDGNAAHRGGGNGHIAAQNGASYVPAAMPMPSNDVDPLGNGNGNGNGYTNGNGNGHKPTNGKNGKGSGYRHSKHDKEARFRAAESSAARSNVQNRKTKICRHFEKGKCWLEDRCAFLHATPDELKEDDTS